MIIALDENVPDFCSSWKHSHVSYGEILPGLQHGGISWGLALLKNSKIGGFEIEKPPGWLRVKMVGINQPEQRPLLKSKYCNYCH